jgi:protein-S-isoprenylcysteine O-methyltransferase Ste14
MNGEPNTPAELSHDPRPASAVSGGVGFAGLAGLFAFVAIARTYELKSETWSLVALLACGVPMVLWSIFADKVHRRPSTGIDWDAPPRPLSETIDYSLVKIAGLWATWAAIGFLYCAGRWYWDGGYLFAMRVLGYTALPLLVLSVPYVVWLDRRLVEPRDGAWHFGQLLIGKSSLVERAAVHEHLRSWAVKGFFTAFMIAIVPGNWAFTVGVTGEEVSSNILALTRWLVTAMFMIDTTFATVGYALTMKPLDAHIRSANPYAAGWTAALICYPPFVLMGAGRPLDYHPGTMEENGWSYWLAGYPLAMTFVAFLLVVLTAIYAWATVAFGIRFSNLTHRGILTHGPYAWTKHPAYVSKNLFWWFATLPFLVTTGSLTDAIRNTFFLSVVSGVYYWRARTEERHLGADPAYRDYAAWMERNAPLPRLLRRFRGSPAAAPVAAE